MRVGGPVETTQVQLARISTFHDGNNRLFDCKIQEIPTGSLKGKKGSTSALVSTQFRKPISFQLLCERPANGRTDVHSLLEMRKN